MEFYRRVVNIVNECKLIFNPRMDKRPLSEVASGLDREYKDLTLFSAYSIISDAIEKNLNLFKMKKTIRSHSPIPKFIFLKK